MLEENTHVVGTHYKEIKTLLYNNEKVHQFYSLTFIDHVSH